MNTRATFPLDAYVADVLMPDLVGHDHAPSAFILYVHLWRQTRGKSKQTVAANLATLAADTGLSRSAVQSSLRRLKRRGLVSAKRAFATAIPVYAVHTPWRR